MKFIRVLEAKKVKAYKDFTKQQIFDEIRENLNSGDANEAIFNALSDGRLKEYDFIYRDDAICVDVKYKGTPIVDRDLTDEEYEVLNHAFDDSKEVFFNELNNMFDNNIIVTGRSGGYWGIKVDNRNINNYVVAEISDEDLEELYNRTENYFKDFKEQYDVDYLIGDYVDSIMQDINNSFSNLTIKPTQKLWQFKNEIEETAKQWESMNFEQFTEGWK